MHILPHYRDSRKGVRDDRVDLPATADLAGWHGLSGPSGIQLHRTTPGDGRLYLAILIPEPLDGIELAMVRRFTHDMGANYRNTEPENAA